MYPYIQIYSSRLLLLYHNLHLYVAAKVPKLFQFLALSPKNLPVSPLFLPIPTQKHPRTPSILPYANLNHHRPPSILPLATLKHPRTPSLLPLSTMNHPRPPSILPLATLKYPRPHAVDGLINQRALSLSVGLGDTGGDVAGIVPRGGCRSWTTACKANEPIAQGSALGRDAPTVAPRRGKSHARGTLLLPLWGATD